MSVPFSPEVSELAETILQLWRAIGHAPRTHISSLDELIARVDNSFAPVSYSALFQGEPSLLRERLEADLAALIKEDPDLAIVLRSAMKKSGTRDILRPDESVLRPDSPAVPVPRAPLSMTRRGLLAGDIPFGRPMHSKNQATVVRPSKPTPILLLGASPLGPDSLSLAEEARCIGEAIYSGQFREWFSVHPNLATRISDIQLHIQRFNPSILHFSCHGGDRSLQLQDERGFPVSITNLSRLLRLFADSLQCVILNACFSQAQASEIADHIRCVVGMFPSVSDDAAILFSQGFYGSLASGRNVADATEFGKARIGLEMPGEADAPHLIANLCDPSAIFFTPKTV